ncbi:MAG: acid--CoA ligase [Rhodospirillaceae bacterium]|nr:acid--CoA ligase [Rhodospirillaceae bacterium]
MLEITRSSEATVGSLLAQQALIRPADIAVESEGYILSFSKLNERVNRLANALMVRGVRHGDRVAVLSENRREYLEVHFAAAKIGAIVCALNWRLTDSEQSHCVNLTSPKIYLVSARFEKNMKVLSSNIETTIVLGQMYDEMLLESSSAEPNELVHPEDALVILYTSGTTGLPKGAVISHRAFIARVSVFCSDYGMSREDTFVAWAPMFHMASTDLAIGMMLIGGKVIIVDGFDLVRLGEIISSERLGWLVLMPGVTDRLITHIKDKEITTKKILMVGAMADLLPPVQVQEISRLLSCPFLNSFGSTETGIPPCSAALLYPDDIPFSLSKRQNSLCMVKLVDKEGKEVPVGVTGELVIRSPTLFSGYWDAEEVNSRDFYGGWFHMGDVFRRNADGTYDFVDRAKYLIKSGGENIYPAEIERVLLQDHRIVDAVVVKQTDLHWGEVPVAVVASGGLSITEDQVLELCRSKLAGYKQPKRVLFSALNDLPRSTTGKILRHEVEAKVLRGEF